eukprot:1148607-Pelagomonas_calceolata.AAC.24
MHTKFHKAVVSGKDTFVFPQEAPQENSMALKKVCPCLLALPKPPACISCTSAAAPAAGGGQRWCWTGLGSWLVRFRLVEVTVAPLAAAAVVPAAAVCAGGGAGEVGAFAAGLAAAAAAAAGDHHHDGGGGLSSCLSCCPSRPEKNAYTRSSCKLDGL